MYKRTSKYRSGFEAKIAKELTAKGIKYGYEPFVMEYYHAVSKGLCHDCGGENVSRIRAYLPDFFIPNGEGGWILEAKGRFTSIDRTKMLRVKDAWPSYVVCMIFMRNNYLTSTRTSTYGDWCDRNDIRWSVGLDKGLIRHLRNMQNAK